MGWRRATFKGQQVYAQVDEAGALVVEGGRVPIRYSDKAGARVYGAGPSRLQLQEGAPIRDLPFGVDAEPSEGKAEGKAKTAKSSASRGSGFGSAGSRTASQAAAAAADAEQRMASLSEDTIRCFTDGSCRGNPGPAGSGVVVLLPDGRRAEVSRSLGRATNNVAELTAIGIALDLLDEVGVPPAAPVVVFTDSKYADGVLTKRWKAKANTELIEELRLRLRRRPGVRIQWVAGHVGVAGNEQADELANRGVAGVSHHSGFHGEVRSGEEAR
jgi:ribonuclease HI